MIRTKDSISILPKNRLSGQVYMQAIKLGDSDLTGRVEFLNTFSVIKDVEKVIVMPKTVPEEYCVSYDEATGVKTMGTREVQVPTRARVVVPTLVKCLPDEKPSYSQANFDAKFGLIRRQDYDLAFINEIDAINRVTVWPEGVTPVSFWDLTAEDLEVVTPEMLEAATAPTFIEWLD